MLSVLLAAILASNGTGKTLVRTQPGRLVPVTASVKPVWTDDANTVCHAYFNGSTIRDSMGCAWTMAGTVPMVAKSGTVPAGAGPFSTANKYTLGTGNDALDFAGAFLVCVLYRATSTATQIPFANTNGSSVGYYVGSNPGTGRILTFFDGSGHGLNSATTKPLASTINCICAGRDGGTGGNAIGVVNSGTLVALTANQNPATSSVATIGTDGTSVADGTLYEIIFKSTGVTEAQLYAMCAQAKTRLGASSW